MKHKNKKKYAGYLKSTVVEQNVRGSLRRLVFVVGGLAECDLQVG